jgi:SAM-dependent methyltransferase
MVRATDIPFQSNPHLTLSLRFGLESLEKIVEWAVQHAPPSEHPWILEIGSGNGTLLFALMEAGYAPGSLSGIDYSADAVKLAWSIAGTRGGEQVQFNICDFLKDDPPMPPLEHGSGYSTWDVLLDKGTFDAIALGEKDENGTSPAAVYPYRIARLLKPRGHFLITCAFLWWTRVHAIQHFYLQRATSRKMNS